MAAPVVAWSTLDSGTDRLHRGRRVNSQASPPERVISRFSPITWASINGRSQPPEGLTYVTAETTCLVPEPRSRALDAVGDVSPVPSRADELADQVAES